jgi:nucleoside-diphosphate-sugar epimerase
MEEWPPPPATLMMAPAPRESPLFPARKARRRLKKPLLAIVGCGDIGRRIVARLRGRFSIVATATQDAALEPIRAAGARALALDLDLPRARARLRGIAANILVLAPASREGDRDARSRRLLALLAGGGRRRMVYVSTSGVYGDRAGAWTDETVTPRPSTDRARRRLDAENRLRASPWHAGVLRAPGIYARERLPTERLEKSIPVPQPGHDIYTNHIHAEDLARACIAAVFRGAPARVYNVVDDSQLQLGQYLDLVADHAGLPRPPRAPWSELARAAGPERMSFLSESRRLRNWRLKRELRFRLLYPDVAAGLADV